MKTVPFGFAEVVVCSAALAGNVLLRVYRQELAEKGVN